MPDNLNGGGISAQFRAKEPPFRVVKRAELPLEKLILFYVISVLVAVVIGGLFIALNGVNPFLYFKEVFSGCFRSGVAFRGLARIIVPLLMVSLGVILAFKMRYWNIGAEGQLIMGAVFATWASRAFPGLPTPIMLIVMAVAGIIGGGIWGLITAFFKCRFNTNETLFTLMLNYVAFYIVDYLRNGPWQADPGFPGIGRLAANSRLPQIFRLDISWIVAIVLVFFIYIYLKYTKQGYEIAVVGDSISTARYAGMNVNRIMQRTMFLSAGICGLAGMLKVSGVVSNYTLDTGIASGVGFTAISVAWLAKLNPFGVFVVSFLFGVLEKGCSVAESTFHLSAAITQILQGLILFTILGSDFFIRYKLQLTRGGRKLNEHNN